MLVSFWFPFKPLAKGAANSKKPDEAHRLTAALRRTSREGDKWSGHVAFPGGKREAEDADDRATAARETKEALGWGKGRLQPRISTRRPKAFAAYLVNTSLEACLSRCQNTVDGQNPRQELVGRWFIPFSHRISSIPAVAGFCSSKVGIRTPKPGGFLKRAKPHDLRGCKMPSPRVLFEVRATYQVVRTTMSTGL